MQSLLDCNSCGEPVQVLGKAGAILNTFCPGCGKSSGPQIAKQMSNAAAAATAPKRIIIERKRVQQPLSSEPPAL